MKAKYQPGTPDGLCGKTYPVEVVAIKMAKVQFNQLPYIKEVQIKYQNGTTKWVSGMEFYSNTYPTKTIQHLTY